MYDVWFPRISTYNHVVLRCSSFPEKDVGRSYTVYFVRSTTLYKAISEITGGKGGQDIDKYT